MPEEAAAQALRIAGEVHQLTREILDRLGSMTGYARRTRLISWGLAVTAAFDIALSVIIFVLALQVHASQLRACEVGNGARAAQVRLWDHVLAVSAGPQPGESPVQARRQEKQAARLRRYVHARFAPVDCAARYPLLRH